MRNVVIYTVGFTVPLLLYFAADNLWWKMTRFEARMDDGRIYVVDRRTGQVTLCVEQNCRVIHPAEVVGSVSR